MAAARYLDRHLLRGTLDLLILQALMRELRGDRSRTAGSGGVMPSLTTVWAGICHLTRNLCRRGRVERELGDEINGFFEMLIVKPRPRDRRATFFRWP
jgi:hypothetical protein